MPADLRRCPNRKYKIAPQTINDNAEFWFHGMANADSAPVGHYFRYWTSNTRDTNDNVVSPYIQDQGYWVQIGYGSDGGTHEKWQESLDLTVTIGLPPESSTKPQRDSLHVYFRPANGSAGAGYLRVVSTSEGAVAKSGSISGLSALPAGSAETWQHVPTDGDTTGFFYQWYINGSLQPADTGAKLTRAFSTAGDYTLRVDQTLVDTTYTYTKSVSVQLAVAIGGPSEVLPYSSNEYTASASGGSGSYTYVWYVDGGWYSTGSTLTTPFWDPGTAHTVKAVATDSNSKTGESTMPVYSSTNCQGQPGCNDALRITPMRKKPDVPQQTRPWWRRVMGPP